MTSVEYGGLLFGICLVLIALRMPVAVAMFAVGGFGFASLAGWPAFLNFLNTGPFGRVSSYTLSVIPLFLLMGQFAARAGLGRSPFRIGSCLGRALPRRIGDLDRLRMRGVRFHLRILDRNRCDDGVRGSP